MERLKSSQKVVGLKQSRQAVLAGKAEVVFAAEDADAWVMEPLVALCKEHGVEVAWVPTMKELAKACKVEVPTACVAILGKDA